MNLSARFRAIAFPFALVLATLAALVAGPPAFAQTVGPVSGLKLPRFVSVDGAPTNVRVGPGTRYDIAWTFVKPGVPVEIVQEFDTWRKIRDVGGEEGWVHQGLVVSARTGLVTPWASEGQVPLRAAPNEDAAVRAWLGPNILVNIRTCDGRHCEVAFSHGAQSGRAATYSGFIAQSALWGAYEDEVF